jgi:RimJ/RimL family protein N-acetyltransferase
VVSREADLSLWLARGARQQHIGTDAARAIIDWATHTLRLDVNGVANPDNAAAIALMTALHMEDQGEMILQSRLRGTAPARVFVARRAS